MAARTLQDKTKGQALDKLEKYLKEYLSCDSSLCPLKSFDIHPFERSLSQDESKEISSIINRLNCTWELKRECDLLGIVITCPRTHKECDIKCGTE